jgi:hypothetical protein
MLEFYSCLGASQLRNCIHYDHILQPFFIFGLKGSVFLRSFFVVWISLCYYFAFVVSKFFLFIIITFVWKLNKVLMNFHNLEYQIFNFFVMSYSVRIFH